MTDTRKFEALKDLCAAVSRFDGVSLADLDDEVIDGIKDAFDNRHGYLVTQIESARNKLLRVSVQLSHVIDGERSLVQLLVVENMPTTIQ